MCYLIKFDYVIEFRIRLDKTHIILVYICILPFGGLWKYRQLITCWLVGYLTVFITHPSAALPKEVRFFLYLNELAVKPGSVLILQ